jgi:hypothetical protein
MGTNVYVHAGGGAVGHRGGPRWMGLFALGMGEGGDTLSGCDASPSHGGCPVLLHTPAQPTLPLEPVIIPKLQSLKSANVIFREQLKEMGIAMVSGPLI